MYFAHIFQLSFCGVAEIFMKLGGVSSAIKSFTGEYDVFFLGNTQRFGFYCLCGDSIRLRIHGLHGFIAAYIEMIAVSPDSIQRLVVWKRKGIYSLLPLFVIAQNAVGFEIEILGISPKLVRCGFPGVMPLEISQRAVGGVIFHHFIGQVDVRGDGICVFAGELQVKQVGSAPGQYYKWCIVVAVGFPALQESKQFNKISRWAVDRAAVLTFANVRTAEEFSVIGRRVFWHMFIDDFH